MTHGNRPHLHGVLLAGGSGTRLWPLSIRSKPKQFLSIGAEGSLISQTAGRLKGLIPQENLWVVCGKKHAESIPLHLKEISVEQILVEPEAKNTAPAIALAALQIGARDPEAVMMVLPADHLILKEDIPAFVENLSTAAQIAGQKKALVTLGIPPSHPATGFGYMERGVEHQMEGRSYYNVRAFHEKPDGNTAQQYLEQGGFYWNSGMFIWEAQTFLKEMRLLQPEMYAQLEILTPKLSSPDYPEVLAGVFRVIENISVDYAIMEKAKEVYMVPADFSWDDVGDLTTFTKVLSPDDSGNRVQGQVFTLDAKGNLVLAETKPIALIGVENLIVVETKGAVLVLPKERAQDVKKMVEKLKGLDREDLL